MIIPQHSFVHPLASCVTDRAIIYLVYQRYVKILHDDSLYDEMDIVLNLHKRISEEPGGWAGGDGTSRICIEYLYVDETQDFTQAELLLFWRIMRDPNKSVFAGDTAQAIARGVSFRFADITTMAYALTRGKEAAKLLCSPITVVPEPHALVHNYRSHNGILRLAATVVQLIQKYFPLSIDPPGTLPPDQGVSKPCLVSKVNDAALAHSSVAVFLL